MKKQKIKEKGITLIALVITIIVLLILAGVTLSILLNTGIIENSQKAVNLYQSKAEDEVKQIDDLNIQIQTQFGILDNTEGKENKTITGEKSAYNNPVIPVGFKTSNEGASWKSSDGETVDGWDSGLVIEDKDGNQFVWIPCYIKEEDIKNVEDINKLVKYKKTLGKSDENMNLTEENFETILKDELPSGVIDEESQIKNGGFYIARYEAGIPETMKELLNPTTEPDNTQAAMANLRNKEGVPVSKKNQVPWNHISYNQAKANAEKMYNNENVDENVKNKVKSGLLTGKMWDTTLQWLIKTNAVTEEQVNQNSTSWGNYRTSTIPGVTLYSRYNGWNTGLHWEDKISTKPGRDENVNHSEFLWLLKTGNTEYTKRNNIYDLAGNLWEVTLEMCSSDFVFRGGDSSDFGKNSPASVRDVGSDADWTDRHIGFRVALYISAE